MRNHTKTNDHPAPDGIRRKLLGIGTLSGAFFATLLAGFGRAATPRGVASGTGSDADNGREATSAHAVADQIRELKAREDIKELRAAYCWYATRADAKSYAKLFTYDCVFEYKTAGKRRVFEGRDAIAAIVAAIKPGTVTPIIGNHTIILNGNEASGTCAARNTILGEDGTSMTVAGFYHDKFRFEENRWRFSERRWFTYAPEYEDNNVQLV